MAANGALPAGTVVAYPSGVTESVVVLRIGGYVKKSWCFLVVLVVVMWRCSDPDVVAFIDFDESLLINQLKSHAVAIDADPLSWSNPGFIDPYADRAIIGLGEATHGTKEFSDAKARLFRYLAEHHGFRMFCIEADFAESLYLDACLNDPQCNVTTVMQERMLFWTWRTTEVRDFLQWIQEFNANHDPSDRIHYVGIDGQAMDFQSQLLLEFMSETENALDDLWLEKIAGWTSTVYTADRLRSMTEQEYLDDLMEMDRFKDALLEARDRFEEQVSSWYFATRVQLVVTLMQAFEVNYHYYNRRSHDRDRWMADNALWAQAQVPNKSGVAIWAHNAHIAKDKHYDYFQNPSMGYFLSEALQDDYASIGFGFSRGSFTAVASTGGVQTLSIDADPMRGSLTELFHHAEHDAFWMDIQRIDSQSGLGRFFSLEQMFLMIGAGFNGDPQLYYRPVDLAREYDGLIYFDISLASHLIPRSQLSIDLSVEALCAPQRFGVCPLHTYR